MYLLRLVNRTVHRCCDQNVKTDNGGIVKENNRQFIQFSVLYLMFYSLINEILTLSEDMTHVLLYNPSPTHHNAYNTISFEPFDIRLKSHIQNCKLLLKHLF